MEGDIWAMDAFAKRQ